MSIKQGKIYYPASFQSHFFSQGFCNFGYERHYEQHPEECPYWPPKHGVYYSATC